MEELQDAIEDVQYLQAVNTKDGGPRPTEGWSFPSDKELEEINAVQLKADPDCFQLETICSSILGMYLFGEFCAEKKEKDKHNFMLDVIRYRCLRRSSQRQEQAQAILREYLVDGSANNHQDTLSPDSVNLRRKKSSGVSKTKLEQAQLEITHEPEANNRLGVAGTEVERLVGLIQVNISTSCYQWSLIKLQMLYVRCLCCFGAWQNVAQPRTRAGEKAIDPALDNGGPLVPDHHPFCSDGVSGAVDIVHKSHCTASASPSEAEKTRGNIMPTKPIATEAYGDQSNDVGVGDGQDQGNGLVKLRGETCVDSSPELFDVLEGCVFNYLRDTLQASFLLSEQFIEYTRFLCVQRKPVSENDFILFRVLGRGGFGAVNGCKRGASGKLFAMKVMNKRRIKIRQSEDLCWNERRILQAIHSPFVVSLKYAFESKQDLFLILDLMTGGDLGFHLQHSVRFSPAMAQYYTARTALGIGHLHQQGIVYRDLKPENIMLDEHGRSRISDMGLACKVTPNLTGACGTRGYWSPEMRLRESTGKRVPYNQCVDWFSLGCVVYEFLHGTSPFRTARAENWCADTIKDTEKRLDKATLEMEPEYPGDCFDATAADFCRKLLAKGPAHRLGKEGVEQVLAHPWFKDLDMDALVLDQIDSPFIPNKIINAAPQRAIGSFADAGSKVSLTREDQAIYEGWAYTSEEDFQQEVVDFLIYREQQGAGLDFGSRDGSCCTVS
ncbi:unnamed protein product [Discosporangium mesarthrocarpum]